MHKVPRFLCLLLTLLILWSIPFTSAFADVPFVKPGQDIVVPLAYEDLQFWERTPADPLFTAPQPLKQDVPILTVIAIHIGAKDCIVLQCGDDAILLDCGDPGPHDIAARVIRQLGIDHFTAAINTHPHDDHLSAFPYILSQFPADVLYVCFPEDTNGYSKTLHKEMAALNVPVEQLDIDQPMQLGAATLNFRRYNGSDNINYRSLVIQAVLGDRTILLTADASATAFKKMIASYGPDAFQGDILKAPHHGIDTLTGELIRAAHMQAIFVTAWPWGDKVQDFLKQLRRIQIEGVFTGLGSVVMKTDGEIWTISQLPRELP